MSMLQWDRFIQHFCYLSKANSIECVICISLYAVLKENGKEWRRTKNAFNMRNNPKKPITLWEKKSAFVSPWQCHNSTSQRAFLKKWKRNEKKRKIITSCVEYRKRIKKNIYDCFRAIIAIQQAIDGVLYLQRGIFYFFVYFIDPIK